MTGERSRGGSDGLLGRVVGRLRRALAGDGAPEPSVAAHSKFLMGPRSIARLASVEPTGDLALVAIVRDETPHLAEWIEFHYLARADADDARRERALEEEDRADRVASRRRMLEAVDRDATEDLAIQRFVPELRAALGTTA